MEAIITDYLKDQFKTASGKTLTGWRCCHRQASQSHKQLMTGNQITWFCCCCASWKRSKTLPESWSQILHTYIGRVPLLQLNSTVVAKQRAVHLHPAFPQDSFALLHSDPDFILRLCDQSIDWADHLALHQMHSELPDEGGHQGGCRQVHKVSGRALPFPGKSEWAECQCVSLLAVFRTEATGVKPLEEILDCD